MFGGSENQSVKAVTCVDFIYQNTFLWEQRLRGLSKANKNRGGKSDLFLLCLLGNTVTWFFHRFKFGVFLFWFNSWKKLLVVIYGLILLSKAILLFSGMQVWFVGFVKNFTFLYKG